MSLTRIIHAAEQLTGPGLALGHGGLSLFLIEELCATRKPAVRFLLEESLAKILNSANHSVSLFHGRTGTYWLLRTVQKLFPELSQKYQSAVEDLKASLLRDFPAYFSQPGRYELMNGAAGVGIAGALTQTPEFVRAACEYLLNLESFNRLEDTSRIAFDDGPLSKSIDTGVAHGIAGVIGFLAHVPDVPGTRQLSRRLSLILKEMNTSHEGPLPRFFPGGEASPHQGWCYGDLSIGLTVAHAGEVFGDEELRTFGRTLTAKARVSETTGETHLCHGLASFALMTGLRDFRPPVSGEGGLLTGLIGEELAARALAAPSHSGWENLFLIRIPR